MRPDIPNMMGWPTGRKHSEETKRKMSIVATGHKVTKQSRKRMSLFRRGRQMGPDNPAWKGGTQLYRTTHKWIRLRKPAPKLCERCNKVPPFDLSSNSGKCLRDINDWEYLCRHCHMLKDNSVRHRRFSMQARDTFRKLSLNRKRDKLGRWIEKGGV